MNHLLSLFWSLEYNYFNSSKGFNIKKNNNKITPCENNEHKFKFLNSFKFFFICVTQRQRHF